jgi:hypothetical protein
VEDPRLVHRAVAGFAVATGVGSLAGSLYSWDVSPLAVWALMMVGTGATFRGVGKLSGARPAEPGAAAARGRDKSAE